MTYLYWKYCPKCSKPVGIDYYPFNASPRYQDDIDRELTMKMNAHQRHLCIECDNEFATCKGNPIFGECLGNDNVLECSAIKVSRS